MATEFVLTLPFAVMLVVSVLAMAALGVRAIVAQSAALRAARVAALADRDRAPAVLDRALPAGLSDCILRGGDTPSPYCRAEGGYGVCGYPED